MVSRARGGLRKIWTFSGSVKEQNPSLLRSRCRGELGKLRCLCHGQSVLFIHCLAYLRKQTPNDPRQVKSNLTKSVNFSWGPVSVDEDELFGLSKPGALIISSSSSGQDTIAREVSVLDSKATGSSAIETAETGIEDFCDLFPPFSSSQCSARGSRCTFHPATSSSDSGTDPRESEQPINSVGLRKIQSNSNRHRVYRAMASSHHSSREPAPSGLQGHAWSTARTSEVTTTATSSGTTHSSGPMKIVRTEPNLRTARGDRSMSLPSHQLQQHLFRKNFVLVNRFLKPYHSAGGDYAYSPDISTDFLLPAQR